MTGEDYVPRPSGRFVRFADQPGGPPAAPYTWPQDTLRVPNGYGSLPLIDHLNANLAKREFFGVSAQWLQPATDSRNVINIPLPKDGDFWLDNICTISINDQGGSGPTPQGGLVAYLQIEDGNNGYPLMSHYTDDNGALINGAPWGAFNARDVETFPTTSAGQAFGAGTRTNMIQPYCFLRGGAIRITLTVPPLAFPFPPFFVGQLYDWYVSLAGWKEYAYAAV
jgi:hypothetical protein